MGQRSLYPPPSCLPWPPLLFPSPCSYYLNNFQDGRKQDALDLVAGNYVVQVGAAQGMRVLHWVLHWVAQVGAALAEGECRRGVWTIGQGTHPGCK